MQKKSQIYILFFNSSNQIRCKQNFLHPKGYETEKNSIFVPCKV